MQIKCDFYSYESSQWHQYEIDLDLNVYPCCHYYTEHMENGKINERISHIDNNLKTNSLNNIFYYLSLLFSIHYLYVLLLYSMVLVYTLSNIQLEMYY